MGEFTDQHTLNGFSAKLWRGERMALLGFDVDDPEDDFVGFAIEYKGPKDADFCPLFNRIAFSYDKPAGVAVTGKRQFDSNVAPFQKFRWVHFPFDPSAGDYVYRATRMHMPQDNVLKRGQSVTLKVSLDPVTYHDFLDVGFTRNFASSQAFLDKFPEGTDMDAAGKTIIPTEADAGLTFKKATTPKGIYE